MFVYFLYLAVASNKYRGKNYDGLIIREDRIDWPKHQGSFQLKVIVYQVGLHSLCLSVCLLLTKHNNIAILFIGAVGHNNKKVLAFKFDLYCWIGNCQFWCVTIKVETQNTSFNPPPYVLHLHTPTCSFPLNPARIYLHVGGCDDCFACAVSAHVESGCATQSLHTFRTLTL